MKGFIFMLDAFLALMIVVVFVSNLSSFTPDYSFIQDETMYRVGKSMMLVLIEHPHHPLSNQSALDDVWEELMEKAPSQFHYKLEYYDGSEWKTLKRSSAEKYEATKRVAVVLPLAPVVEDEGYEDLYCGEGAKYIPCTFIEDKYKPYVLGTDDLSKAYVRLVVEI